MPALRAAWAELAEGSGNLFATPEWLLTWWAHLGEGDLEVWTAGEDATPRAILPLKLHAGELRFLGHGAGDRLGPVAAPADAAAAAGALGTLLRDAPMKWDVFVGDDLPGAIGWTELTGARVVRRTPSPVLDLHGLDWAGFLASRSAGLRAQARRRTRRVAAEHRSVFRHVEDATSFERDLDTFFALHAACWGERADPAFSRRARAFHTEFAALALERGWLRLHVLELDGRPAASLLNFRFGGAEWFYQGGRDPAFGRESVGFVLHLHAIREAIADGLDAYRMLRGGEPYKVRLATRDEGVVTVRRERTGR